MLFVAAHLGKGGGLALQMFQMYKAMRREVEAEWMCLDAEGPHRYLHEEPGVRIVGKLSFPKGIGELRRALKAAKGSFDIAQVIDSYYALPAAYLARTWPRVVHFGTDPAFEMGGRYGIGASAAIRLSMPVLLAGTRLVVNSKALASRMSGYSPMVIPNGVDFHRFDNLPPREVARKKLNLPADKTITVTVCKVIALKRTEWVLEVARQVPQIHAVIVGGFTEEHYGDSYYRELLSRYPDVADRVTFTGEMPSSKVDEYLAASDIFAFPSSFEGLPNAVMEGMAAGLPVVASDIPPHRELIREGEQGYIVRDPGEMARAVRELAGDEGLRRRMGAKGKSFIKQTMSIETVANAYLDVYRSLLGT